jgi:translation initiation factor 1A
MIGWKFPSPHDRILPSPPWATTHRSLPDSRIPSGPVPATNGLSPESRSNYYKLQALRKFLRAAGYREPRQQGVDALTENRRGPAGGPEEIVRVRLPNTRNREIFACAELMMGANHIRVRCFDGVTRMGRIKGKIKKKIWIREGDILIVVPWSFQDDKCDIVYRYTGPQVEWLRRNGYL